ncbi:MAG: NUDIX domain-containing protein [bacterium]
MEEKEFRVGTGVMIFKDGKVLIGRRKSKLGEGDYSFPGGHLEHNELITDCIKRETREECGIEIKNLEFIFVGNIRDYPPRHYIGFGFTAEIESGEPKVMEPDKLVSWDWYNLDELPEPLFIPTKMMIEAYKNKINFIDA